jgi:FkbM family methyltransferase
MLGARGIGQVLRAACERQHYIALRNMSALYPKFRENLWRYLTGQGDYPYDLEVRTPVGVQTIRIYSYHDMLTVNEIFCRQDYFADGDLRYVLDLGSNIGISARYFLSRNYDSKCILYEPDVRNVEKLKENLKGLEERYILHQMAVSDMAGTVEFGIEPTGRYGGIALTTGKTVLVQCMHVNEAIDLALQSWPRIDILKIDTEGVEIQTVEAIRENLLSSISSIYIEARPETNLHPHLFRNRQYGSVRQLLKNSSPQLCQAV